MTCQCRVRFDDDVFPGIAQQSIRDARDDSKATTKLDYWARGMRV